MFFCYYLQLTDFGESIIVGDDWSVTRERGTLEYSAPERCIPPGEGIKFGTASDIYSLGTFHLVSIPS